MASELAPAVGTRLGSYRVELLLGRGGMGVVYCATDLRLGRKVALKLLAPQLTADARFRERFLAESRLAASIDHAGIIPIYEAGEADGHLFIAMRYVEGTDLGALLRSEGRLAPERAVGLVEQLAGSLDAAHERGLVHRDVKPSNALVAHEGAAEHVYLADFGLTEHLRADGPALGGDQPLGTTDYLAPERIRGGPAEGQADLYALGCVLFECLVGEVPYARDSAAATLYAHLEDEPPRVSERRPGLPRAVDDVVARALAKDPADRWPSGVALAEAARAALPDAGRPRASTRRRGPPARVLAALAVIAGLAAVAGVLLGGADKPRALAAVPDADAVAVIDPHRRTLVADVRTGSSPTQIAVGAGAVWAVGPDRASVTRIDPRTQKVRQTINVGDGPTAVAVGAGGVWVTNGLEGTLTRISPTNSYAPVVATRLIGNGPTDVCVAAGAVWVALSYDSRLLRYDPVRDTISTTTLDDRPTELACRGGSVWVSSESAGTVTQVSAADGQVIRSSTAGAGASGIAVGAGGVWVANTLDGTVSWFDSQGRPRGLIGLGRDSGPHGIATDGDDVWVSNEAAGTVVRIDPHGPAVADTLPVGNRPQGLAVVDGRLWLGVRGSGARHRGGTLRTLHPRDEGTLPAAGLDPAFGYFPETGRILGLTNDGLVAFQRVGGRAGATPIADLATALPSPTDGGRTYTFQLRRGLRYSTGVPVRAADLRRGLERALSHSAVPPTMYATIRGAAGCGPTHGRCDLSAGIQTDDRARTVVFRLKRPDPDFLFKLAMPFAVAVPAATPTRLSTAPLPATGPYRVASFRRTSIRLVRNPRFRPVPGRPDGYPDAIEWIHGGTLRNALHAVEAGRADLLGGTLLSGLRASDLDLIATGQLHRSVQPLTFMLSLNTKIPPFDHVAARQALNYAIDRRRSVAAQGGDRLALPTCQILPPNFPGYRLYAPYCPSRPGTSVSDSFLPPDLARARRLVARSGTKGMRVTIVGPHTGFFASQARQARTALAQIGYRVTLRTLPVGRMFDYAQDPRNRVHLWPVWWIADYPSADNYLSGIVPCATERGVCDRATRRLIAHARRGQLAGGAADAAWARVDRRLTDRAAVVPLTNLRWADVVSPRLGNYQYNPQQGLLLDQAWVR